MIDPKRGVFASLLLVLGACTKVVSIEEQGIVPPISVSGVRQNAILDQASGAERLTSGLGDELSPALNTTGLLLLYQSERYESAGGERKLVTQAIVGSDPNKKAAGVEFTEANRLSSQPAFLPDGSYVYVTNAMGPLAIVHAQRPTPNAAIVPVISSDFAPEPGEPAASPDGLRVAFSMRGKAGGRVIGVVGLDGSKLVEAGEGRAPSFHPDGQHLIFVRTAKNGFNHLFYAAVDGFASAKQLTEGEFDCDRPAFSPDGARIVFAANRGWKEAQTKRSDELNLFVIEADGRGLTQLTKGTRRSGTPHWGSDGFIYFTSDREGTLDLYRIKAPQR